jgi:hypothetical protein
MLHQVKDLSPEQKRAAEVLLGQAVSEDDAVSIKRLCPTTIIPSKLSPEERLEALRAIERRFADAKLRWRRGGRGGRERSIALAPPRL